NAIYRSTCRAGISDERGGVRVDECCVFGTTTRVAEREGGPTGRGTELAAAGNKVEMSADRGENCFEVRDRDWRGSDLAGDPGSPAVGSLVDLLQRRSAKIFVDHRGGEGVTSADCVGHLHTESGMWVASVCGR